MINVSEEEYYKLKEKKMVFPVVMETCGDELTPIGIYYSLKGKNKFLLESAENGKGLGRYSFIGSNPYMSIKSYKGDTEIIKKGSIEKTTKKVLDCVRDFLDLNYNLAGADFPFTGGGVGYVGYDVIRQYEDLPDNNHDEINVPEAYIMFYKTFICYDHFKHTISIVYNVFLDEEKNYKDIVKSINFINENIRSKNIVHDLPQASREKEVKANFNKEEFCSIAQKAKEYIKKGDVFQVVLSQRFDVEIRSNPFDVYRRLRSKNPSPYLFYIDFNEFQIVGSSPESLVSLCGDKVITNPIAGTRPRGKDKLEDEKLKEELLCDEKERAEHVMLVDLGRNDIGRASEFGTVKLDKFMEVDFYSHVMHIVSKVSGKLKSSLSCFDALISCLPAGTVSGAPKVRAMEIIDELENVRRGIYAGAVGYFSYGGNMDTCIAIRTIIFKNKNAYIQAGAGIVYDSNPESEYVETLNKAMALKEAL